MHTTRSQFHKDPCQTCYFTPTGICLIADRKKEVLEHDVCKYYIPKQFTDELFQHDEKIYYQFLSLHKFIREKVFQESVQTVE